MKSIKKGIIATTPIEISKFGGNKNKIIITGEWCNENYGLKNIKSKMELIKYPFKNKSLKKQSYFKIINLYEILLIDLIKFLNKENKVKKTKNYWEQIIGVWLLEFLIVAYEKYLIVKRINDSNKTIAYKIFDSEEAPSNSISASNKMNNHECNNQLFCYFIEKLKKKIVIKKLENKLNTPKKKIKPELSFKTLLKQKIIKFVSIISMLFRKKGEIAPRKFIEIIGGKSRPKYSIGSGRLELAMSVVDKKNPLTSRVMVNRIWGWHFGNGLVRTPSNFGVIGEAPTHSELLDIKGEIDLSNIIVHYRPTDDYDPFQTDIYTLRGEGVEIFTPKFNYKGFQFVEVLSNKPIELTKESLTGIFMHSDVPSVGRINSSNPLINKLWSATNNAYLSNLYGYPTDCPQREKNGWTGDAHIAIEMGLYNFDGITVYEKWLNDHRDEQQPNGVLPAIIPTSGWGYHWANGPDWTSSIAIIPWNIYLFYGDKKLLKDSYENIKRYVDHITDISPEYRTDWGLGDWVPVKSKTPKEFTSSIYYFVDATILAKTAKILEKEEDFIKYSELASRIKKVLNSNFFNPKTAIYGSGFQTELSTALFWGIVPKDQIEKVAHNLAKKVISDNKHIDVGLLGSKAILNALSENGYADLAYQVATQKDFPSWGAWIKDGATTLYEDWKVDKDRKGAMSRNHIIIYTKKKRWRPREDSNLGPSD